MADQSDSRELDRSTRPSFAWMPSDAVSEIIGVVSDAVIVIDTGESNEEMISALCALREVTTAPIAAVIYTHFHYVAGTQAVLD